MVDRDLDAVKIYRRKPEGLTRALSVEADDSLTHPHCFLTSPSPSERYSPRPFEPALWQIRLSWMSGLGGALPRRETMGSWRAIRSTQDALGRQLLAAEGAMTHPVRSGRGCHPADSPPRSRPFRSGSIRAGESGKRGRG